MPQREIAGRNPSSNNRRTNSQDTTAPATRVSQSARTAARLPSSLRILHRIPNESFANPGTPGQDSVRPRAQTYPNAPSPAPILIRPTFVPRRFLADWAPPSRRSRAAGPAASNSTSGAPCTSTPIHTSARAHRRVVPRVPFRPAHVGQIAVFLPMPAPRREQAPSAESGRWGKRVGDPITRFSAAHGGSRTHPLLASRPHHTLSPPPCATSGCPRGGWQRTATGCISCSQFPFIARQGWGPRSSRIGGWRSAPWDESTEDQVEWAGTGHEERVPGMCTRRELGFIAQQVESFMGLITVASPSSSFVPKPLLDPAAASPTHTTLTPTSTLTPPNPQTAPPLPSASLADDATPTALDRGVLSSSHSRPPPLARPRH
ncbi:hypothetical protein B0H11DRAFT_2274925 [Mycena galericulata]|nr:hypothetical protein B0H11DRAFT_2274925 [Mycena galericulata]